MKWQTAWFLTVIAICFMWGAHQAFLAAVQDANRCGIEYSWR